MFKLLIKFLQSINNRMSKLVPGENDLLTIFPQIAKEWHPTMNLPLIPSSVHSGSSLIVYWVCPKGHTYKKSIEKRTKRGQGCPVCRKEEHSFVRVHPELLKYWDCDRNVGLNPKDIFYGSDKEVWWKCEKGHSYKQKVNSMSSGNKCPICTKQAVIEETSLAFERPDIAAEWHPSKNKGLKDGRDFDISTPNKVTIGSKQKVWWLCPRGHEYQAVIYTRRKTGCPICDSEKRTSFPEQAIAFYLSKLFKIDSRKKIGGFEADVFCKKHNFVVEYDGEYFHNGEESEARENRKNNFFTSNDILLFRVKETKKKNIYSVKQTAYGYEILTTYNQEYYFVEKVIQEIVKILNDKFNKNYYIDIDIKRDKVQIIEQYAQIKNINSFLIQKPLAAKKWDTEKNGNIDLRLLPKTSKKKYWWKCPTCKNEWYGPLENVTNSLTCNKCTKTIKTDYDTTPEILMDAATIFRELEVNLQKENPELASQWHPTKNGYFKPTHVSPKSGKRVWWLCPKCGHEWVQMIKTRNNGKGARKCPICANNQKKENSKRTMAFLDILYEEWHPTKNNGKRLENYSPGSNVSMWWRCSICGTDYECPIKTRKNGGGCPVCANEARKRSKYKKVRNIDTNEVFNSVQEAASYYKISRTNLSQCLRKRTKTAGGFKWKYYNI